MMNSPGNNANSRSESQSQQVPLPDSVEAALRKICAEQSQPEPEARARRALAGLGEESALQVLGTISAKGIKRSFDGFIIHMAKEARGPGGSASPSPSKSSSCQQSRLDSFFPRKSLDFNDDGSAGSSIREQNSVLGTENGISQRISAALNELGFRKVFLLLSYIGREKFEQVISADDIKQLKDLTMADFESKVWGTFKRSDLVLEEDRRRYLEWDSGKAHVYHCHVSSDGRYQFKGPFLDRTRTLLQKKLGDENVLLVKLEKATGTNAVYRRVARDGIFVGPCRYQFFVFKDGGKEERKKDPTTSSVKCYFVHLEGNPIFANRSVREARSFFMHADTVSSISNYMIRFSLILSKTVSLEVDLAGVNVVVIPDIECKDDEGNTVSDKKGKDLIHTDGTGFISADIALNCPGNIFKGNCMSKQMIQTLAGYGEQTSGEMRRLESHILESHIDEPPLLIQCRLFHEGRAVKGTLLVNKRISEKTIQIRRSMIKVDKDLQLSNMQTVNALEVVGTSNKPKRAYLSRMLIALLSCGGVPNEYFLDLLKNAMGDAHGIFSSKRSALKAAINYGEMDNLNSARMILCGIPLEESHLQWHLSILMKKEKKSLKGGRIPIPDSYYLMGTADPTRSLKPNEACIILDSGQISGDVLVYRNPGLHFGDIHVLKATYCKELESYVGNSKYGVFFPSVGPRSLADEIAGGDFDGDMYWVSRNPQLLKYFKPSKPWTSASAPQNVNSTKPSDLTDDELEDELINLWLTARFQPSYAVSEAADSWLALMDRFLTIGGDHLSEKYLLERKLPQLVDLYYDALDQPKKGGQKIEVPRDLRADLFPHYMEREEEDSFHSTSILGLIYDTVTSDQEEDQTEIEVRKVPCFDVRVSESCLTKWTDLYKNYRQEMRAALALVGEGKNESADEVIEKYKKILYEAAEFEETPRRMEDVFDEALAIYNITYDYARSQGSVGKCGFAWKVAGPALCKFHATKQGEKSIICLPSVLREIWS